MRPIATAFVTVYNEETWVQRAVHSLLDQSLRDIEVLVVDDGSDDRTPAILDGIDDERLRVVRRPRAGRAPALAFAAAQAQGRYLANLDADDQARPDRLAEQVAFLEAHPEHAWVGSAEERDDTQRREHIVRRYPTNDWAIRRQSAKCIPYCHSAVTFRREIVERGTNYDPQQPFLIDFEFFLRVAQQGKIANLPEPLVKRRARDESYFQRRFSRHRQNRRLAWLCSTAIIRFGLPPWYHVFPLLRLGYPWIPNGLGRRLRAAGGLQETPPQGARA
jgi:glycosyltransferase involved in cell wall biosynthesis